MGLKKFISQKDIDRAKNTKLPVAKNGKFQSVRGEGTTQSSRFPQLESSSSTQSYYNPKDNTTPPIYFESQKVSVFGRTIKTTKDVLRVGQGTLNLPFTPNSDGIVSVDANIQGVIVGGTDGYVGECFLYNYKTMFKFTDSGVTQVGTAGGIKTTFFEETHVGSPKIYISYNTINQDTTNKSTNGSFVFMISNTGNKITEWSGDVSLKLTQLKLHQSNGGGAIWQDGNPLLFQNFDRLLWN